MNDRGIFTEGRKHMYRAKSGSICPSWWTCARGRTCKILPNSSLRLLLKVFALSEFLLDEKGAKMRELPCTGDTQDNELKERPFHHAGVGRLRLIPKFCFALL